MTGPTEDMNLRVRILMWHRVLAMLTGSMVLAYGKKGLSKQEAEHWVEQMKNVCADIRAILEGQPPILDSKGQRVVRLTGGDDPPRKPDTDKPLVKKLMKAQRKI